MRWIYHQWRIIDFSPELQTFFRFKFYQVLWLPASEVNFDLEQTTSLCVFIHTFTLTHLGVWIFTLVWGVCGDP